MDDFNYYPIVIPTLNRYEHFKKCVESLARNTHADKTELIVGLDYPPSDKYMEGYLKIKKYIPTIRGFSKVTVIEHQHNLGASKNIVFLRDYAFKKYDACISTEDDNEFAPCALDYFNKALSFYKDNSKVVSVSAYNFPCLNSSIKYSTFFFHGYSAWGVGRWKSKNNKIDSDFAIKVLQRPRFVLKLLKTDSRVLFKLLNMIALSGTYGDLQYDVFNILFDKLVLYPKLSLSRNHGHDGSGINCQAIANSLYENQEISSDDIFLLEKIPVVDTYSRELRKYFKMPLRECLGAVFRFLKFKFL